MKKSAIVLGATLVALSLSASQFAAASDTVTQSVTVSYADLNLSNVAGAKTLYGRIRMAARKVCTVDGESPYEFQNVDKRRCIRSAIDQAIIKVGSPVLLAMHQSGNTWKSG
jgi:UrcA family protein